MNNAQKLRCEKTLTMVFWDALCISQSRILTQHCTWCDCRPASNNELSLHWSYSSFAQWLWITTTIVFKIADSSESLGVVKHYRPNRIWWVLRRELAPAQLHKLRFAMPALIYDQLKWLLALHDDQQLSIEGLLRRWTSCWFQSTCDIDKLRR